MNDGEDEPREEIEIRSLFNISLSSNLKSQSSVLAGSTTLDCRNDDVISGENTL